MIFIKLLNNMFLFHSNRNLWILFLFVLTFNNAIILFYFILFLISLFDLIVAIISYSKIIFKTNYK